SDRRYRYPFINCTQCGPRYTICREAPYDRPNTTMQAFTQCPDCEKEYRDPASRRFHAEPNACPACGPRLHLIHSDGSEITGDPITQACSLLKAGKILAIKSLGGFHLACDARNSQAVIRLRERKHRDEKPFALMAANLEMAQRLVHINEQEKELLTSAARPIVLQRRRQDADVASEVAPGNPLLGVMLPYTPLHELLLTEFAAPLIMTSGNLSDEPIVIDNADAIARLASIADALLLHDRKIANRCDDSIVRLIANQPALLRRARGFVPAPIEVPGHFARPVLACGAHLKNTFCLAYNNHAWLGPHIGDLDTHEAARAFEEAIVRFTQLVGVTPEIIAYDLHPDYHSTRYALTRPASRHIGVQHHHAHIAALCAEHRVETPVIGLAWDGTGYGTDGSAWGSEALWVHGAEFRRLATFRPLPLAGGDTAIRQIWRIALAALDDAFDGKPPLEEMQLFRTIDAGPVALVRQMIARRVNSPLAHGAGRYFDAVGALLLARDSACFEGQAAMQCEFLADPEERVPYPFSVIAGDVSEIDLRPTLRAIVTDLIAGHAPSQISGRFHATMAAVAATMIKLATDQFGSLPVAISGGCFQNDRLVTDLLRDLQPTRQVLRHRLVPCGDGGLSLGQALVADLLAVQ
ncbi:MAG TPA: carbamoyltransferase HypF, partial [Phycisphaerae bacterium]|nr:carbamoyltransferase HypF [Phycisphaerae bacterium]